MNVKSILKTSTLFLFLLFITAGSIKAQKIKITTSPQSAKIFVNGVSMGAGQLVVTVPSNECVTVQIAEEGFIPETRTYCKKRGVSPPPKTDYFQLLPDESYTVSSPFLVHFKSRIIVSLSRYFVVPAVGRSGAEA